MKKILCLLFLQLFIVSDNCLTNPFVSADNLTNVKKANQNEYNVSKFEFDQREKSGNIALVCNVNSINSKCGYSRYNVRHTRKNGELYFLNSSIFHNAELGDTVLTTQTFTLIGMTYTEGFGYTTEAKAFGATCSFSADMALSVTNDVTFTNGSTNTLRGKNSNNPHATGRYYLYMQEIVIDSIIVKRNDKNEFISAVYVYNTIDDVHSLVISNVRPTIGGSVLPKC
ncbi:MAG: hypothetical protein RR909_01075 [Bacilli bacterium]